MVTERSFLRVAQISVCGRFLIPAKVNLADVLFSPMADPVDRNRISQKHLDFLLCDIETLHPVRGIGLRRLGLQHALQVSEEVSIPVCVEAHE